MRRALDAVVIGSGPNGLAAAVMLAQAGQQVLVIEARGELGGGMRSAELTLPGFVHDVCSAVHPLGVLSPYFGTLPLEAHGLTWIHPPASVAHPLDDGPAVLLEPSVADTAARLGRDGRAYARLFEPLLRDPDGLLADLLGPLRIPGSPLAFLRFGLSGMRTALGLARSRFAAEPARALFAGCAAHAILPLDKLFTSAVGMLFLLSGHVKTWPVARGGSQAIADALLALLRSLGGQVEVGRRITRFAELPPARAYLFDLAPRQLATIAENELPAGYRKRLLRYHYGPAAFKLDFALSGPIPWRDPACASASTVHVGGTLEEIAASERAAFRGEHCERPFVLVCQQSHFDPTRAPAGKHTGYAYCHVPHGSDVDVSEAIERQIERFAPGFRDLVLARRASGPRELERDNESHVGGVIAGGAADITQLFTRPVARLNPYTTPRPDIFICSSATPPGGGVHGMSGYYAAKAALRRLSA